MMRPRIVVFGNINMDAVVRVSEFPQKGENRLGESLDFLEGGKGANQARAASRLGARVWLVGRVGKDEFGKTLVNSLASEGVNVRYVSMAAGERTGMAFVFVRSEQNRIISVLGANETVSPSVVTHAAKVVGPADMILVQLGIPVRAVDAVITVGKRIGTPVLLDTSPIRGVLPQKWHEVDILSPNESELNELLGTRIRASTIPRAARVLFARSRIKILIAKLGDDGAYLATRDGLSRRIPAFRVRAIDPTGAGDAFSAAFAVAHAAGTPLLDAARFASAAGALATTKLGAAPSFPTLAAIRRSFPKAVPHALMQ